MIFGTIVNAILFPVKNTIPNEVFSSFSQLLTQKLG